MSRKGVPVQMEEVLVEEELMVIGTTLSKLSYHSMSCCQKLVR